MYSPAFETRRYVFRCKTPAGAEVPEKVNTMRIRVEELFHRVADLSVDARHRYYAESAISADTKKEVEELLVFDSSVSTTLKRDISNVAQQAITQPDLTHIQCGQHRLGALLGRGGMGAVYLGERADGKVAQRVAIKLLRAGSDNPQLRQRFLIERQILATLSHPNIARLLDAGHREDGQPYLVMEYVDGKPIDSYSAELGIPQKINLFIKTCAAVGYLHRNLVVHRDLKPANILVTAEGEPKLLDFGIAKMLDVMTDSTVSGMRMLTPDYASPEQVTGGPITTASDIYSLGAVLYKMLTGASPHAVEGHYVRAIVAAISSGRITPPSKLVPGLKGDLQTVLLKALRREPRERYASVEQFSEDLENYLKSRPIRACKGDGWFRTRRFLRRSRTPIAAVTLAMTGLSAGVLEATHHGKTAERRFSHVRQQSGALSETHPTGFPLGST